MPGVHVYWTAKTHRIHEGDEHPHGPGCGHPSAQHAGQHVDYLVDGHAHHAHEGHWDECEPVMLADRWRSSQ
jgi:hypothetical protein